MIHDPQFSIGLEKICYASIATGGLWTSSCSSPRLDPDGVSRRATVLEQGTICPISKAGARGNPEAINRPVGIFSLGLTMIVLLVIFHGEPD